MSAIYDNWERLVAAVVKKQQLWELFHQQSRSPSILSDASDFTSSFGDLGSSSRSHISPSKLVLISDFCPAFDVRDVALASAELIGRGAFGSVYVATTDDGQRFVVKRLNSVAISGLDFERNMEIVGDVKHENVVALRAYYSSTDEKLMLYDYYGNGSVYSLLHGQNRVYIDWQTRLSIAIGAARGVAEIHRQLGGVLVHGNIKSSNIFLNQKRYGCVSDLGLTNMMKREFMPTAQCYAPEVKNTQNVSQASDVYSFGILLLELLSRKPTANFPGGPEAVDIVKLVNSVKSKERAAKVFDADLLKIPYLSKQMVNVLQIGMRCVAKSRKKRPKIFEVVKMLEDSIITDSSSRALDWATRMQIAVGAAKGISHIHRQDGGKLVHGNINSSNIILSQQAVVVSDAGLTRLTRPVELHSCYSAPEVGDSWKATQASDVYSFGVVLLQLISGRPLWHTTTPVQQLQRLIQIEWTAEVIDLELRRYKPMEELLRFLRLAMDCVSFLPEHRPRMPQVVEELEKIGGSNTLVESGLECVLEDLFHRLTPQ